MEPAQAEAMKQANISTQSVMHLMFGMCVWLNVLISYGMAVAANLVLKKEGGQQRPSLSLRQFHVPTWVLLLLAGCALASITADGMLAGVARVLLVGLLLPYFLSGLCYVHALVPPSPWRAVVLAGIYLLMVPFLPLVVGMMIFLGLAYQCKVLKMPAVKK